MLWMTGIDVLTDSYLTLTYLTGECNMGYIILWCLADIDILIDRHRHLRMDGVPRGPEHHI